MERIANDNAAPSHEDHVLALELVRRVAVGQDATLDLGEEENAAYFRRLGCILQVLERLGLVFIRLGDDGRPEGATLTDAGEAVGRKLFHGHIALFPAEGGIRIVADPVRRTQDRPVEDSNHAEVPNALSEVMAVAPRRYGSDVVEGSATPVLIGPMERWDRHPALERRSREDGSVLRIWEVFSGSGEAYGLVLQTAQGFEGIDTLGRSCMENSLAAAAWQVGVNR